MTVIRPNSITGITSITAQANEINVFRSNGLIAGLNLNGVNFNTTAGISTLAALKVTGNVDVAGVLTYQDVTNVDSLGIGTFRTGINVSGGQLDVGSNIKLGNAGVITATSFVGSGANLTSLPSQLTLSNNADNRVITGGSGTNLNGEENLTFNGSLLEINQGTSDGTSFRLKNEELNCSFGVHGTGSSYPREAVISPSRMDSGSYPILRLAGQGGIKFAVDANTERARIDSSGRVIIGHTATDDRDGYNSALQVSGTGGDDASISIGRWSANASYPALTLSKSRNGTIGSHTVVVADDYLGGIQFQGDDGTNYHVGASIVARVESGVGNDDMPASLRFRTNQGTTGDMERMMIHGGGNGHNILYGGRVDILGYQGTNITGGTNSNVLNEQFLVCPSAASSYDDNHTITFGQTKGDWYQGVNSGYHTSFGLLWNWGGSGGSGTRAVRAGIHYDHRSSEKFKIWSSYGDIEFRVDSGQSGNETAETCNTSAMTITHDGYVQTPKNPYFRAYNNGSADRSGVVIWNSTQNNNGNVYDTSTGVFTAPIAGFYWFAFTVKGRSVGQTVYARAEKSTNGGSNYGGIGPALEFHNDILSAHTTASFGEYLNANDKVRIGSGSNVKVDASNGFSGFLAG